MRIDLTGLTLRRAPGEVDFSDLTASRLDGAASWDGDMLTLPFDVDPTPAEQTAIRRRLLTVDQGEEQMVTNLLTARAALANDTTTHGKILRLLVNDRLSSLRE